MNHTFTYPREKFDKYLGKKEVEFGTDVLGMIDFHRNNIVPELGTKRAYYLGEHDILSRTKDGDINNKVVCNHAKDINDVSAGYFLGSKIAYKSIGNDDGVEKLSLELRNASSAEADIDNALNASIFGVAYDYIYQKEGEVALNIKSMTPMNTFIVKDESIEENELFGVYYYHTKDPLGTNKDGITHALVCTDGELRYYEFGHQNEPTKIVPHALGYVPICEYKNNKYAVGDAEPVFSLIDAYNTLTSDRINDIEGFVDSILVLEGAILGVEEESVEEAQKTLRKRKLLEIPEGAKAQYLTNTLNQEGIETLRNALKQDIYTLAHVPNMSDENFAGNSSGVAMEYKILSLEMQTKTKEAWYRKGLRKRLEIFIYYLGKKGTKVELSDIEIAFSRGLPKNILELSQIIVNLEDKVTRKTLLSLLPFVDDPDAELKALIKQEDDKAEKELAREGFTNNEPIEEVIDE